VRSGFRENCAVKQKARAKSRFKQSGFCSSEPVADFTGTRFAVPGPGTESPHPELAVLVVIHLSVADLHLSLKNISRTNQPPNFLENCCLFAYIP
jgi:hypothetical protein